MKKTKKARLDIRLTEELKIFFEHAASVSGLKMTEFVIIALKKYAKEQISEQKKINRILESKRDQEVFVNALINPPEPNEALVAALDNYNSVINEIPYSPFGHEEAEQE